MVPERPPVALSDNCSEYGTVGTIGTSGTPSSPLAAATEYLARGWSIIPVEPRGKRPLLAWSEYQKRRPTDVEVAEWLSRWPAANVGVVTGTVSGIFVLDIDNADGRTTAMGRGLSSTVASATGGGGWHLLYRHPGFEVRNFARRLPGLDLRGDGGFIVVPPSVHPSGRPYKWLDNHSPDDLPLANAPEWLVELIRQPADTTTGQGVDYWRGIVGSRIAQGERNDKLTRLAGHLLRKHVDPLVVLGLLQPWNAANCQPPLSVREVERVVLSITEAEARRRGVL